MRENTFSIRETDQRTHLVLINKSTIVFESYRREECVEYISKQRPAGKWRLYIVADFKTWAVNAKNKSPLEYFDTFDETKRRFQELRPLSYNRQIDRMPSGNDYYAHLGLGIDRVDGFSAIDILHVKKGMNYLVTDFAVCDGINTDANALDLIRRTASEIGFDLVRQYLRQPDGTAKRLPDIPYSEWRHPYF